MPNRKEGKWPRDFYALDKCLLRHLFRGQGTTNCSKTKHKNLDTCSRFVVFVYFYFYYYYYFANMIWGTFRWWCFDLALNFVGTLESWRHLFIAKPQWSMMLGDGWHISNDSTSPVEVYVSFPSFHGSSTSCLWVYRLISIKSLLLKVLLLTAQKCRGIPRISRICEL